MDKEERESWMLERRKIDKEEGEGNKVNVRNICGFLILKYNVISKKIHF